MEKLDFEKFIEVAKSIQKMEEHPRNNIEKWNDIFDTLVGLKNDEPKLIEFLKSFVNGSTDTGTLRVILVSMKGYPKENQALHDVMETIKTVYKLKSIESTP
jgi:hypothetical protein